MAAVLQFQCQVAVAARAYQVAFLQMRGSCAQRLSVYQNLAGLVRDAGGGGHFRDHAKRNVQLFANGQAIRVSHRIQALDFGPVTALACVSLGNIQQGVTGQHFVDEVLATGAGRLG